ncbi:MAG: hypothetical protein JWN47_538, partial [Frankiales bacterium]|nr:hypothetical protein [Frankiales bacterium]
MGMMTAGPAARLRDVLTLSRLAMASVVV